MPDYLEQFIFCNFTLFSHLKAEAKLRTLSFQIIPEGMAKDEGLEISNQQTLCREIWQEVEEGSQRIVWLSKLGKIFSSFYKEKNTYSAIF